MAEILQNKNLATRFQILAEIAANQPNVQQKDIAHKLNITPQAVSEHMIRLEEEGWVTSEGRSRYKVTQQGVNWVLKGLRELRSYSEFVRGAVTGATLCAAIADSDLSDGQAVGLVMRDGLLVATARSGRSARGRAAFAAKAGDDVAVSHIEGIIEFEKGRVLILKVPDIQRGGSKAVDLKLLKKRAQEGQLVGAIGIESLIALRAVGVLPTYLYGVTEAVVEAARSGLSFAVACSADAIPGLVDRLTAEDLLYELVDASLPSET